MVLTRLTSTWGRAAASAAAALLLVINSAGYAGAHHGGRPIFSTCPTGGYPWTSNCSSVGNDRDHYVYVHSSVNNNLRNALLTSMSSDYDPTQLRMFSQTSITAWTDVRAYAGNYSVQAAGWVVCETGSATGVNKYGHVWCLKQGLRFNFNFSEYFNDGPSLNYITCHELGHTLGLQHWGQNLVGSPGTGSTCMHMNTPNGPTVLHQYDRDHINAYYYNYP